MGSSGAGIVLQSTGGALIIKIPDGRRIHGALIIKLLISW